MKEQITSLHELRATLECVPDGTTCNVLVEDLEAGNFEEAHFELPKWSGIIQIGVASPADYSIDIEYSGPIAEGYVSLFGQA